MPVNLKLLEGAIGGKVTQLISLEMIYREEDCSVPCASRRRFFVSKERGWPPVKPLTPVAGRSACFSRDPARLSYLLSRVSPQLCPPLKARFSLKGADLSCPLASGVVKFHCCSFYQCGPVGRPGGLGNTCWAHAPLCTSTSNIVLGFGVFFLKKEGGGDVWKLRG